MEGNANSFEMVIVEFANLETPPELNDDLLNQIDMHIKGTHWANSHQCITMLRSIVKFYPQFTCDVMGRYGVAVLDHLNNGRTQVIKNIFKLLQQLFLNGRVVNIEAAVAVFLPVLVKKAVGEKGHIKDMSQEVLTVMANHCGYNRVFELTAELSCDKNNQISDLAIKLLAGLIQNVGAGITQLNPDTLQLLIRALSCLVNGKRNDLKTSALDVCMLIYSQLGSDNFLRLLTYALPENEVFMVGQAMENHRAQKTKHVPLSEALRQRKSMLGQTYTNGPAHMGFR